MRQARPRGESSPTEAPHRFGFVIINYKTTDLVLDCLKSFAPEIDAVQDRVVVVDNDSGDGAAEEIQRAVAENGWDAWCRVYASPNNGGFSAGNNLGMQLVDARYYWLTNSDTLCRPGAIEEMARALDENPDAGLVAPRLEWQDGACQVSRFRYHSPFSELIDAAATGPITSFLRRFNVPIMVNDASSTPEWVSFASVVVRREVVEQIGWMDEGYFMYYEDVDYCRRARDAGWGVAYAPASRVVHLRGGSSPVKELTARRGRRPAYYYRSRSRYYAKFYGVPGLWLANALWLMGYGVARLREFVGNKKPHVCQLQWLDNWTNWRRKPTPEKHSKISFNTESVCVACQTS